MKNSINIDEKMYDKIIAVAYNDASLTDRFIVYRMAKRNSDVKKILEEYKRTANALRNIKPDELPDTVIDSVNSKIENSKSENLLGSLIYSKIVARPLLSSSIVGLIILGLSALLFFNQPQPSKQYSKAEIELAQKQLSESLAIVNRVFKNAEQQLDKKVVPNIINKNIDKGFNLINDLLIGG